MMRCQDSSAHILDQTSCLDEISKGVRGRLRLAWQELESCAERRCETFKTIHQLDLQLQPGPCEPEQPPRLPNGQLYSCDLTHALKSLNGTAEGRGFHGGTFTWVDQGFLATGTLSGITNAGTHRAPIFEPACQRCDEPHVMEGRFCGIIRRSVDPGLLGCQVFGAYLLQFDKELTAPDNEVRGGVLEGVVVCECRPAAPLGHESLAAAPSGVS